MTHGRTWILLGASALLSANAIAQGAAPGSGIRVSKDNAATTTTGSAPPTVVSGGEVNIAPAFSLTAYATMTEGNFAAHLLADDSLEIGIAQLAQLKATDHRVRDYATMLANDHSAHLAATANTVMDAHVPNVPMVNDVEGQRMTQLIANLTAMPAGTAWDAAFVRSQIQHHQNELDLLNANIRNAHGDDFEDLLDDTLAALGKHRDAAKSLATTLGISM